MTGFYAWAVAILAAALLAAGIGVWLWRDGNDAAFDLIRESNEETTNDAIEINRRADECVADGGVWEPTPGGGRCVSFNLR